jgi:hypothetical protein
MRLKLLDFFANPVSKNGEPLYDKNAHLAWYRGVQPPEPIPTMPYPERFLGNNRQRYDKKLLAN